MEEDKTIWGYAAVVNEEKQELKRYMILIKRTTLPLDEKLADKIITRQLEKLASEIDIKIESSIFVHGTFDWIICFKAKDMKQAKKFCEVVNEIYWGIYRRITYDGDFVSNKNTRDIKPRHTKAKRILIKRRNP